MHSHASSFARFLMSNKAERDKAQGAAQWIMKKIATKGRLVPQEKILVSAFVGADTSGAGKAFAEDARRQGYTEVEWTYRGYTEVEWTYATAGGQNKSWNIEQGSAWNIEQGSAWTIEQGSAWTIEQGSAWKVEEGETWKVEWTELGVGGRVPAPSTVARVANSFAGA